LEWRKGNATGAKGEISAEHITRPGHVAANRGFFVLVPNMARVAVEEDHFILDSDHLL